MHADTRRSPTPSTDALPDSAEAGASDAWRQVEAAGIALHWRIGGAALHCRLRAPVQGWVGVGWAPPGSATLAGLCIFSVDGSGRRRAQDHAFEGNPPAFEQRPLQDAVAVYREGEMAVVFELPLDYRLAALGRLQAGKPLRLLLACGEGTHFTGIPRRMDLVDVVL